MLKRTALFEEHKRLNGRMVDFGGWELPVQYTGVMDEHLACRKQAGLFDVSHMGEFIVEGEHALAFLNYVITNDLTKIVDGQAQYTAMCFEHGGIVDDLIIYRRSATRFFVVVNASNTDKDFDWMQSVLKKNHARFPGLRFENVSSQYTQIAIQGPRAVEIAQKITATPLAPIRTYGFAEGQVLGSVPAVLARTGYTGEDGFEIYVPWDNGPEVWRALLEHGTPLGLKACGLGARDTLRLEMKYPLYGHELTDQTHPLETGLGWVTKLSKEDFVGKSAIELAKSKGITRASVGLQLKERGIPRQGYKVFSTDGVEIGVVTSGTQSPSTGAAIAVASIATSHATVGSSVCVDIRGTHVAAAVVKTPFVTKGA